MQANHQPEIRFGTTYPTWDLGTDPDVLGQWARDVERAGYDELFIPEHVLGVNAGQRPDWRPLNPNTLKNDKRSMTTPSRSTSRSSRWVIWRRSPTGSGSPAV